MIHCEDISHIVWIMDIVEGATVFWPQMLIMIEFDQQELPQFTRLTAYPCGSETIALESVETVTR